MTRHVQTSLAANHFILFGRSLFREPRRVSYFSATKRTPTKQHGKIKVSWRRTHQRYRTTHYPIFGREILRTLRQGTLYSWNFSQCRCHFYTTSQRPKRQQRYQRMFIIIQINRARGRNKQKDDRQITSNTARLVLLAKPSDITLQHRGEESLTCRYQSSSTNRTHKHVSYSY